jgi:Fic family protein
MDSSGWRGEFIERTWGPVLDAGLPRQARRPCRYRAFVPAPVAEWMPTVGADTAAAFSEAETLLARVDQAARDLGAAGLLGRLLLRTESIASSKIEGITIGAREYLHAEARLDSGRSLSRLASEVVGNVEAMQHALETLGTEAAVSLSGIQEIHRILLAGTDQHRFGGLVRGTQNWIGGNDYNPCGADFVPTPPEHLGALLDDLIQFLKRDDLSPGLQAAITHVQFETLHPFADGNGRTGRALIHVLMRRRRVASDVVVPLSLAFAGSRDRYIEALTRFRRNEVEAWFVFFAGAMQRTATATGSFLRRVDDLRAEWRHRVKGVRSDSAVWAIIGILGGYPVVSLPSAIAATGRARGAVNNGLRVLEEAGVLLPVETQPRHRLWEAAGLLEALAELETGLSGPSG